jgi:hypothetical protein
MTPFCSEVTRRYVASWWRYRKQLKKIEIRDHTFKTCDHEIHLPCCFAAFQPETQSLAQNRRAPGYAKSDRAITIFRAFVIAQINRGLIGQPALT